MLIIKSLIQKRITTTILRPRALLLTVAVDYTAAPPRPRRQEQVVVPCRSLTTPSRSDEDWIPPNRPLIGDQQPYQRHVDDDSSNKNNNNDNNNDNNNNTKAVLSEEEELRLLQQEIDKLEQMEQQQTKATTTALNNNAANDEEKELRLLQQEIDRIDQEEQKLQKKKETFQPMLDQDSAVDWLQTRRRVMGNDQLDGLTATLPGKARHEELFDVDVVHHTLLKKDEIAAILTSLGGTDVKVIYDDPHNRRMGGAMGMIIVTASRPSQIRILADTLVRQMRRRKLQQVDVFGAMQGPEGTEDSNWMVVDCRNFVVHILGPHTRKALNLEAMWSGKDGLHNVPFYDDDAVEDYVAANPVPADYGAQVFDWDEKFRELQKNRWTAPHKPVVKRPRMKRRRR